MSQPFVFSLIDKAIYDYDLVKNNDTLLIAASGGKDSTVLVEYFANRLKRKNCNFKLKIIHIETEITSALNPELEKLFASWGVECENVKVDVLGRLKPNRKMNCYWCSTQRRTELLRYALANGCNKIVLGHHMDDFLETLIMNTLTKSELACMSPILNYEKYPVSVIRPLCYVQESYIIEHAKNSGYISQTCTCNYQDNSKRKEARKKLEFLTDSDPVKKNHLFISLKNIKTDYIP